MKQQTKVSQLEIFLFKMITFTQWRNQNVLIKAMSHSKMIKCGVSLLINWKRLNLLSTLKRINQKANSWLSTSSGYLLTGLAAFLFSFKVRVRMDLWSYQNPISLTLNQKWGFPNQKEPSNAKSWEFVRSFRDV